MNGKTLWDKVEQATELRKARPKELELAAKIAAFTLRIQRQHYREGMTPDKIQEQMDDTFDRNNHGLVWETLKEILLHYAGNRLGNGKG